MRKAALLYVNGVCHEVGGDRAGLMLSEFLRTNLRATGTKVVCAEGDCGACTVLRWSPLGSPAGVPPAFEMINSCITTVAQMDGSALVTVEGIASADALDEVQRAMVDHHGSQCGYCTPGFVMALSGLVERRLRDGNRDPIGDREAKNYLTGNLCRCTGYRPILDAACAIRAERALPLWKRYGSDEVEATLREACKTGLHLRGDGFELFAPVSVAEAARFAAEKETRVLGAGTDLGVLVNKGKLRYARNLSLHLVPSLYEVERVGADGLRVGARVTLSRARRETETVIPELSRFLDLFASPQIKNAATLVGNVANASPIADTAPFLLAADAIVLAESVNGARRIPLSSFYLGYRKTALAPEEIVTGLELQIPAPTEHLILRKVSMRKDLDISCVNAAFRVKLSRDKTVESARIAFGGVAAIPLRLKRTEAALTGKRLDDRGIARAIEELQKEISPLSDLRGSAAYRRVVAENLAADALSELSA